MTSVPALAENCPNFSGTYGNCTANTMMDMFQIESLKIVQNGVNIITTAKTRDGQTSVDTVTADGTLTTTTQVDPTLGQITIASQVSCKNDTLINLVTTTFGSSSSEIDQSITTLTTTGIRIDTYVDLKSPNDVPSATVTCVRQ